MPTRGPIRGPGSEADTIAQVQPKEADDPAPELKSVASTPARGLLFLVVLGVSLAIVAMVAAVAVFDRAAPAEYVELSAAAVAHTPIVGEVHNPDPQAVRHFNLAEVTAEMAVAPADIAVAVDELKAAIAIDPQYSKAQLRLAELYFQLENVATARAHLQTVQSLNNDAEGIAKARALIKDLD